MPSCTALTSSCSGPLKACDKRSNCCYTTTDDNTSGCAYEDSSFSCGDTNGYIDDNGVVQGWSSTDDFPTKGSAAMNYRQFISPDTDGKAFPKFLYTQACWKTDADDFPSASDSACTIKTVCQNEFGPEYSRYQLSDNKCDGLDYGEVGSKSNEYAWDSDNSDYPLKSSKENGGHCYLVGNIENRGCAHNSSAMVCGWTGPLGTDDAHADPTGCYVDGQAWALPADSQAAGSKFATWLRCPKQCAATANALPTPDACPDSTAYIANYISQGIADGGISVNADFRVRRWIADRCTGTLANLDPNSPPADYDSSDVLSAQNWCTKAGIAMSQYCYAANDPDPNTRSGMPTCDDITGANGANCDDFFNNWCTGVATELDYSTPSICGAGKTDWASPSCACSCINSSMATAVGSVQTACYDTNCEVGGYIPSAQIGQDCPDTFVCNQNWMTFGEGNAELTDTMTQTCSNDTTDGTTVESDTDADGNSTNTTTYPDGSMQSVTTDADGNVTNTTYTDADGNVTSTDENGVTTYTEAPKDSLPAWVWLLIGLLFILLVLGGLLLAWPRLSAKKRSRASATAAAAAN